MLKRCLAGMLTALLMCAVLPAGAEIVGRAGDDYIHRYTAPNGQEIYFTATEREPPVEMRDLNGDGEKDIVIAVAIGASNAYYAFWLWDGDRYAWAMEECPDGRVCNYSLDGPGRLIGWSNNGSAGALFDAQVYSFEGAHLKLLRHMTSDYNTWYDMTEDQYTEHTELNRLCIRLYDDADGAETPWEPVWETVQDLDRMTAETFDGIAARLTDGLE